MASGYLGGESVTSGTLADGSHTFRVFAVDDSANANWGPTTSLSFTIDANAPSVPALIGPSGNVTTNRPTFSWNPSSDGTGSGVKQYELLVQSDVIGADKLRTYVSGTSYTPNSSETLPYEGLNWYVRAEDNAGRWSSWSPATHIVVLPPEVTAIWWENTSGQKITDGTTVYVGDTICMTVQAQGMRGQTATIYLYESDDPGADDHPRAFTVSIPGNNDIGRRSWTVEWEADSDGLDIYPEWELWRSQNLTETVHSDIVIARRKSDLVVTDILMNGQTSLPTVHPGESVRLDFDITNQNTIEGSGTLQDVHLKWWWGTSQNAKTYPIDIGSLGTINGLGPNESERETDASWSLPSQLIPGTTYWITAEIDWDGRMPETNEENNVRSESFRYEWEPTILDLWWEDASGQELSDGTIAYVGDTVDMVVQTQGMRGTTQTIYLYESDDPGVDDNPRAFSITIPSNSDVGRRSWSVEWETDNDGLDIYPEWELWRSQNLTETVHSDIIVARRKPDLTVLDILIDGQSTLPQDGEPGQEVAIRIDTKNAATQEGSTTIPDVPISWYWGTAEKSTEHFIGSEFLGELNGLAPGEEESEPGVGELPNTWNLPTTPGVYWLTATIDPSNDIPEINESNNSLSERFRVQHIETVRWEYANGNPIAESDEVEQGSEVYLAVLAPGFDSSTVFWADIYDNDLLFPPFDEDDPAPNGSGIQITHESGDKWRVRWTATWMEDAYNITSNDYDPEYYFRLREYGNTPDNVLTVVVGAGDTADTYGLDRWWATVGEDSSLPVTWTVVVPQTGEYRLDVDIDNLGWFDLGGQPWDLEDGSTVTVSRVGGGHSSTATFHWLGDRTGNVNLGLLPRGSYELHIDHFVVPHEPVAEEVTFQLYRSIPVVSDYILENSLDACFVADRPAESIAGLSFQDGFGENLLVSGLSALVEAFAPILWFEPGEKYDSPVSVTTPLSIGTLKDGDDVPLADTTIGEIADANAYIDLPGNSSSDVSNTGNSTVYASVVSDLAKGLLAINYWFYYAYSNWEDHGGYNNHESDWEGYTVYFAERNENVFEPIEIAVSQHEKYVSGIDEWDGGQKADWSAAITRGTTHPSLYVGLGGHATYFAPEEKGYWVPFDPLTIYDEEHWGDGTSVGFGDNVNTITYLDRAPSLSGDVNDWALFPGRWGQPDLTGANSGVDGDDGPRGPVFQERWADPWKWMSGFSTLQMGVGGDGSYLANGEWTIISHGLSTEEYDALVTPSGHDDPWMWQLAQRIRHESVDPDTLESNVAIHVMDPTADSLDCIISDGLTSWSDSGWSGQSISVNDPGYHHILLYNWAEVSNYLDSFLGTIDLGEWLVADPPAGASGEDGYAEASADFLYALLQGYDIADSVQSVIGYSRGGVVASELVQRLLTDGDTETGVVQNIYLDAEGGGVVYDDDAFYAWAGTGTDNYYSSVPDMLGGHEVLGARNFDDGLEYAHINFPHYLIGDLDNGANDGLFIDNGLIVTRDTPAVIDGTEKDPSSAIYDPPEPMEFFNGTFEYTDSTAGWWYQGSSITDVAKYGTVEEGMLWLDSGECRTHNWSYVPLNGYSVEFDFQATTTSSADELVVHWSGPNGWSGADGPGDVDELGRFSLTSGTAQLNCHVTLPASAQGQVGRLMFAVVGSGSARVWVDNITYSDQLPPNTAPTISDIANRTINEDGSTGAIPFMINDAEKSPASLIITKQSSNASIVPLDNVMVSGSGTDRNVTVTPLANQYGQVTITLTVSDGFLTASDSFVLTINSVNDAPTVSSFGESLANTATLTFTSSDFAARFTDPDTGDTLEKIRVLSLPDHGTLTLGAANVTANQEIVTTDLGGLAYTPTSGYSGPDSFRWNGSDGMLYAASSATVDLTIGSAVPSLSIGDVALLEGDSGTTTFVFTVALSAVSSQDVFVKFSISDGTATLPDNDYDRLITIPEWEGIRIPAGETTTTATVTVFGDTYVEPDEYFFVNLYAPVGATIGDGQGVGTIVNDDIPSSGVHVEGNSIWNNKVYISWQNTTHVYEPDSTNMVIDTWKVDDDGDGDPRNDQNRIQQNHPEDCANGIYANIGVLGGAASGAVADVVVNADGSVTLSLSQASDVGSLVTTYTVRPDDENIYAELDAAPNVECSLGWGIRQISGVWVSNGLGSLATYDQIVVDGQLYNALPSASSAETAEGEDYWNDWIVAPDYDFSALISTEEQWATGMIVTDASIPVGLQGRLMMSSQYGGWGFDRNAALFLPSNEPLLPGETYHFSAIFHADQDLTMQGFKDLVPQANVGWNFLGADLTQTNYQPFGSAVETSDELVWETTLGSSYGYSLTGDVDSDGRLELVRAEGNQLSIYDDQGQLQVQTTMPTTGVLRMLDDVNGDGILEIGISGKQGNATTAYCFFYDGDGTLLQTFERTVGYDGVIYPVAVISPGKVLVMGNAGYSKDPRGLFQYDYATGNCDWSYNYGFSDGTASLADIDRDGRLETTIGWGTVHNGYSVNGTTDGALYLTITDDDGGNLLTQQYPSPNDGIARHIFDDIDQDGTYEIVAIERHDPTYYHGYNEVHIYDLDGNILHTYTGPYDEDWTWVVGDIDNDGWDNIVVGGRSVLTILDQDLRELRTVADDGYVQAAADLNGDGYAEIVTTTPDNLLRVYDCQLNLIDSIQLNGSASYGWPGEVVADDIDSDGVVELLVRSSTGTHIVAFAKEDLPPTGGISICSAQEFDGNLETLDSRVLRIEPWATDDTGTVDSMRFCLDGVNWEDWQPYSAAAFDRTLSTDFLEACGGEIEVQVQYRDMAGNESAVYGSELGITTISLVVDSIEDTVAADGAMTLREALLISALRPGETITFAGALYDAEPATILLTGGQLEVESDVIIQGPGADLLTIDAKGESRVFYVNEDATASLIGLKITGGVATDFNSLDGPADFGGGICNHGTLTVLNSTVSGNWAEFYGGGISNNIGCTLTVSNSLVADNSSTCGGGIYSEYGTLRVENSTVSGNMAGIGGGIFCEVGQASITGSSISNNRATWDRGGGIFTAWGNVTSISDCTISGNSAGGAGGGIYSTDATLTITSSVVSDNSAGTQGGGVVGYAATLTVTDVLIAGNSAINGGGLFGMEMMDLGAGGEVCYGTMTITDSTITGNSAENRGGGIYNDDGCVLSLEGSHVSENSAQGGGGIYNVGVSLFVTDSVISENLANGNGGGVYHVDSYAIIRNSAITDNVAGFSGGGIANADHGAIRVENSTISGNVAECDEWLVGGGGVYIDYDTNGTSTTIVNSTIVNNVAMDGAGISCGAGTESPNLLTLINSVVAGNNANTYADVLLIGCALRPESANNLIGKWEGSFAHEDSSPGVESITGTPGAPLDPMLTAIADEDGSVLYYCPMSGSPAIDAGSNLLIPSDMITDQRGMPFFRLCGAAVDIGACEVQNANGHFGLVVTTADDTADATYSPTHLTLRDAVAYANDWQGGDMITFDPSLAGQTVTLLSGQLELTDTTGKTSITGLGADQLTISGNHVSRVFSVMTERLPTLPASQSRMATSPLQQRWWHHEQRCIDSHRQHNF